MVLQLKRLYYWLWLILWFILFLVYALRRDNDGAFLLLRLQDSHTSPGMSSNALFGQLCQHFT